MELTDDCFGRTVDGSMSEDVVCAFGLSEETTPDGIIVEGGVETESKADDEERRDSGAAVLECASESCNGEERGM